MIRVEDHIESDGLSHMYAFRISSPHDVDIPCAGRSLDLCAGLVNACADVRLWSDWSARVRNCEMLRRDHKNITTS